jgi:hypothetical protein
MARRLALSLSLAALVASGVACHKAQETDARTPRPTTTVWADILAQRDAMHVLMTKELEDVTHEDCAQLGADSRKIEDLMGELRASVAADKNQSEGHLRALGDVLGQTDQTVAKIRESALNETPGAWAKLRFPLDQSLRSVETYFTAEQLGDQSVVHRPGFEASPPPSGASPI